MSVFQRNGEQIGMKVCQPGQTFHDAPELGDRFDLQRDTSSSWLIACAIATSSSEIGVDFGLLFLSLFTKEATPGGSCSPGCRSRKRGDRPPGRNPAHGAASSGSFVSPSGILLVPSNVMVSPLCIHAND